jgi:hypothetical protein
MLLSFRDDLTGLRILPEVLKVDYDATVEIGIAKMSLVSLAIRGYVWLFSFHHARISK